jgi:glyoxylase-like metal-dependent hydrolase (beta-lactamase superfamily II)
VTFPSAQFHRLSPSLAVWQTFDQTLKTDLFTTAISGADGTALIDPIGMVSTEFESIQKTSPICAIVVTNENHWRGAGTLAQRLSAPVFAHPEAALAEETPEISPVTDGDQIPTGLLALEIPGAAPGEIAVFSPANKGTLIVGDALINFEPYGFTLLPAKYCADQKMMRQSLWRLLDHKFERILFAHGFPILSGASGRLRSLLEQK